ncbi:MAG: tetratricopeptide repeat protein [Candidatus Woesebacteria bacterium]|nr:MAG: tetratricopeptide repeat protein [Candidatus Woesebacteria bacterium]
MIKILKEIQKYLLYIVVATFPVFILSNSTSPEVLSKLVLLVIAITAVIAIWILRMIKTGNLIFNIGKFDLGVLLLALAYILSGIVKTANKPEAFFIPGTASIVAAMAIIYFLINQLDKKAKTGVLISFFASGIFLSLSIVFSELGIFTKIPQLPAFIKVASFNPLGGALPSIIYLVPIVLIGISLIIKDKDLVRKIFWAVANSLVIMAIVILIGTSLPGKAQSPKFPSMQSSWEIAVGTVAKSPVFGIGVGNYLTAFNLFRPVTYNQTSLWSVKFSTASNYYLSVLTEVGFSGIFALTILFLSIFRFFGRGPVVKNTNEMIIDGLEKLSLAAIILTMAFYPASPVAIFPIFILLGVFSNSEDKTFAASNTRFATIVIGIILGTGIFFVDYFGTKALIAESTFKKSLEALGKNDAKSTFDLMQKAVQANPGIDRYHASLAQVDMALAQSIANKKDLTDSDKNTITQLVQQAIIEGKATVALNPERSGNWEILAQIYRSVMPFASGADQFTIQSYSQAVALDPTNPNLRIALGGVYYALGRYDDSIDTFKLAVLAKPDLANAHYNLAITYKAKKNYDSAISEMNLVLSLVAKDSEDYKLAKNELDNLMKDKPATTKTTTSQGQLTTPQSVSPNNIEAPITLP